jgi:hypothetical protein
VQYTMNPSLVKELTHDRRMQLTMFGFAEKAARHTRRFAPTPRTGHYRSSIFAAMPVGPAAAIYGSDDFKAWWVEFGYRHKPGHFPLIRAALHMGMRVDLTRGP